VCFIKYTNKKKKIDTTAAGTNYLCAQTQRAATQSGIPGSNYIFSLLANVDFNEPENGEKEEIKGFNVEG